jgi:hypothetical protein
LHAIKSFLEHAIDRMREVYLATPGAIEYPVDVRKLAEANGIAVKECEMIPEAVLRPNGKSFIVFLQTNFRDLPGLRVRQRFSLAHEICHTFFLQWREGAMKRVQGAPIGEKLEAACHMGAGMILIPERHLKDFLRTRKPVDGGGVGEVAQMFDTSPEVALRRLIQEKAFDGSAFGLVLVRRSGHVEKIETGVYPDWIPAVVQPPTRGVDFVEWLRKIGGANGAWIGLAERDGAVGNVVTCDTPIGRFHAKPIDLGGSLRLFELSIST